MQSEIGRRIRALRTAHQPPWSINRLALMARLDPDQLSRAERGLAGLSLPALKRIAALLDLSLAELIDPDHCGRPASGDSPDALAECATDSIWAGLDADQLSRCSRAEQDLIRHHIRSAIEEGIKRAQILAEREIELILNKHS